MNLMNKPILSIVCILTLSMLSAHSIAQDERDIGEVGDSPYEVVLIGLSLLQRKDSLLAVRRGYCQTTRVA